MTYLWWHGWVVQAVSKVANQQDIHTKHHHLSNTKWARQDALVDMNSRHENVLDPVPNQNAVDLVAIIADDIVFGYHYRWVLSLPGRRWFISAGGFIITAAVRIDNRELDLSFEIDGAHPDRQRWLNCPHSARAFTLGHSRIIAHRIAWSVNH